MPPIVKFDNVSVRFILEHQRPRSFQDALIGLVHRQPSDSEEFWALDGVSFDLARGETLGIVGENGSGKSTILKLITRILEPTRGVVSVQGKVSALIELGAGFHPDLTGRENIYLNGSILGLGRKEMNGLFDEILRFSELERFIDTPVKHYSSGMYTRLGFSVATSVDPDLLIIDEVLSVGDEAFQHKCIDRINEFRRRDKSIIFVSHGLQTVEQLCDRVIWLHHGKIRDLAEPSGVLRHYVAELQRHEEETNEAARAASTEDEDRSARGEESVRFAVSRILLFADNERERSVFRTGEPMIVRVVCAYAHLPDKPYLKFEIRRRDGLVILSQGRPLDVFPGALNDGDLQFEIELPSLPLTSGSYELSASFCHEYSRSSGLNADEPCVSFSVWGESTDEGIVTVPTVWRRVGIGGLAVGGIK